MASNSISTINKLKSFAVSPCSSQDFEVSTQNSETVSTPVSISFFNEYFKNFSPNYPNCSSDLHIYNFIQGKS